MSSSHPQRVATDPQMRRQVDTNVGPDKVVSLQIENGDGSTKTIRIGKFLPTLTDEQNWCRMVTNAFLFGRRHRLDEIKDAMSHDDET